ncbi:hypothetical protein FGL97_09020 [Pseudomonas putida]|uniref:hypothetical protein n=1 Tax=Pseudomonas putida TaxID=303 RepID=UPI00159E64E5|nr:hypothetical protein [Pseudomonas putida]NVN63364.1 hypothetical protein [Pseudomonas putida]NVN68357.1 hypothetical protein [Pseudomonas putida]
MSDDVLADLAAEMTGTTGVPDDAGLDQAVPEALADDIESYDRQAEIRDAHLADPDAEPEQEAAPQTADKRVPLGALQEERNLRKQAQDRERELQAQATQMQAELQQHRAFMAQLQQAQQQAAQQAQIPNFEDDPEGHMNARLQQIEQAQLQQQQAAQQQAQLQQFGQQLQNDVAQLSPHVLSQEEAFADEHPDYREAIDHLDRVVGERIAQQYPGVPPEFHSSIKAAATLEFARDCVARGVNPAEMAYSKAREFGFTPSGQRVPGQQRRAAPTTLSTIPAAGRAPDQTGKLTAKDIASMPQEDFDKLFESMRDTQRPQF